MKKYFVLASFFFASISKAQQNVNYDQTVAIYVKGGGYLKYEDRSWGINLGWSSFPVYEWEFKKAGTNGPIQNGVAVQLYNKRANNCVIYGSRDYGINLVWGDSKPEPRRCDWFVEGDLQKKNPSVLLKNKNQSDRHQNDPYFKYGERSWGINLVWTAKPADLNIQIIADEVNPSEITTEGGTWTFGNFKTSSLNWESFSKAFDLGPMDEDSWNPLTPAIFFATKGKVAADGNCFGMCLAAEFIAERNSTGLPYVGRVSEPILGRYPINEKMKKAINVFHWKQLSTKYINGYMDGITRSCTANVAKIQDDLANNRFGILNITNDFWSLKGHILIPYKVQKIPGTANDYKVFVYDPNRPITNSSNISESAYPPLIVKGNTFTYVMKDGSTWSDKMGYVSYERSNSYDNLLNNLFDVGYILLGEGTEIEQIKDSEGRKLFKNVNGRKFSDLDFSLNGLGQSIFPFVAYGNGDFSLANALNDIDSTGPGKIMTALINQKNEKFATNARLYLVKNSDLNNLQITLKTGSGSHSSIIEIGNKKEFLQVEYLKKAGTVTKPELTISKMNALTDNFTLKPSANTSEKIMLQIGKKKSANLENIQLEIPEAAEKIEAGVNPNNDVQLQSVQLKGKAVKVIKTTMTKEGIKTNKESLLNMQ